MEAIQLEKLLFGTMILILFGCSNQPKYDCTVQLEPLVIKQFVESPDLVPTISDFHILYDSIEKFERSIGSTIVFKYESLDSNVYNPYLESLFNSAEDPLFTVKRYNYYDSDITIIIAFRPQTHPFMKEVAVYGMGSRFYQIMYYYEYPKLDDIMPSELKEQYSTSFNEDEFWCFKDQIFELYDEYHGVGETKKNYCEKNIKEKRNRAYNKIGMLNSEKNWDGTKEEFEWIKNHYDNSFKIYYWNTANCGHDRNNASVFSFYSYLPNEEGDNVWYTTPEKLFIEINLFYDQESVEHNVYKEEPKGYIPF